ncbi:uncharacterized protein LOC8051778 [Ixodes scapularis]|uniref:uncharacterized protein LOC8051778 n=1 Tax=Ixodes scapularis TaxID=6945 RepID=UPI001A9EF95D|nr:uncharacterized protein LOC8051778 [Ixodes scapularis]
MPSRIDVLCAAAFVVAFCHILGGSINRVAVPIKNGKCDYDGHLLSDNSALDRQSPCEKVICDTEQRVVYIGLCPPVANPENCEIRTRDERYPYCCPQPYCGKP